MLLHDNYRFSVIFRTVVLFHYKKKCVSYIFCCKCILIMADSEKELISDENQINRNRSSRNIPASLGLSHTESPTHIPSTNIASTQKKKPTSFQITSVTVQGSRLSTDGGEDSADDLDESHTEELSSDILDCSRTTDVDNDQLSEDNSNVNNEDLTKPSLTIPVTCISDNSVKFDPSVIPVSIPSDCIIVSKSDITGVSTVDSNMVAAGTFQDQSVKTPPLSDQWQHRFKVVKIISSQPFKRGRWLCMDFMDPPPTHSSESKSETYSLTSENSDAALESVISGDLPINRLAHVYEIPPNESYPGTVSVTVNPQQIHQPLYGIFLPLNSHVADSLPVSAAFAQTGVTNTMKRPDDTTVSFVSKVIQPPSYTAATLTQSSNLNKHFDDQSIQQQNSTQSSQQSQPMPSAPVQQQPLPMQHTSGASLAGQSQVPVTSIPEAGLAQTSHQSSVNTVSSVVAGESKQIYQDPQVSVSQSLQTSNTLSVNSQLLSHTSVSIATSSSVIDSSPQVVLSQVPSTFVTSTSQVQPIATVPLSHAPAATSIPDSSSSQYAASKEIYNVPSQVSQNHLDGVEHGTPYVVSTQPLLDVLPDALATKSVPASEDTESAPSGSNAVAIDNKIEQAMDLVKSHLMFAVREEVDVLKEKITELMERISQLEYENNFLKANAAPETLDQLSQSQQQQQVPTSVVQINLLQSQVPLQRNIQNQQSTL